MLDLTKPLQTRDGREVRIYATDGEGAWPVHGAIYSKTSGWQQACWRLDGRTTSDFDFPTDLVNAPPKMIKRRVYVTTWDEEGWTVTNDPICQQIGAIITAFNFPVDIEIPEGYGL